MSNQTVWNTDVNGGPNSAGPEAFSQCISRSSNSAQYSLSPKVNNSIDFGTSSLQWKDAFFSGTVYRTPQLILGKIGSAQTLTANLATTLLFSSVSVPTGFAYNAGDFQNNTGRSVVVNLTVNFETNATVSSGDITYISNTLEANNVGFNYILPHVGAKGVGFIGSNFTWQNGAIIRIIARIVSGGNVSNADPGSYCLRIAIL